MDNNEDEIMVNEDVDPIEAYRQSLSDLVFNSKPHIVLLTMLAEDSKDTKAADIVQCIEERLYEVNKDVKLPTLYLIDSIIKNVPSYITLFQKKIIKLFCHAFEKADEKTRLLLFRLRQTWNGHFPTDILFNLDLSVRKIDSGWPIISNKKNVVITSDKSQNGPLPSSSSSSSPSNKEILKPVVHQISTMPPASKQIGTICFGKQTINISPTSTSTTTSSSPSSSSPDDQKRKPGTAHPTIIFVNEKEIITQKNKPPIELPNRTADGDKQQSTNQIVNNVNKYSNTNNTNNTNSINTNNINNNHDTTELTSKRKPNDKSQSFKTKKKFKSNDTKDLPSTTGTMNSGGIKSFKTKIPKRKQPTSPTHSSTSSTINHPLNKQAKKNIQEDVILPVAPVDVIPLGRDHHISVTKRPKGAPPRKENNVSAVKIIKNRRSPSTTALGRNNNNRNSPANSLPMMETKNVELKNPPTMATTIPAPNVFTQPEILFNYNNTNSTQHVGNTSNQTSNFVLDRDYRQKFETVVSDAQKQLRAGTITSADHELLVREAERQFYELQNQHLNVPSQPLPPNQPQLPAVTTSLPVVVSQPQQYPCAPNIQFNAAAPTIQPSIVNSSTNLEPPYGSSAIYINKQFVRLFYLDHITSIVSFKVHPDTPFDHLVSIDPVFLEPKQVYFSGHPTKVTVDPDTPNEQSFCLKFNESQPFIFTLPGTHSPQRIMLGLPDRELIINDRPIKAQFGGPPVTVFMDCDLKNHLFVLSDSRPFLKVSEEPRYDLWHRLVNEAKVKSNPAPPPIAPSTSFNYGNMAVPPINVVPTMSLTTVVPTPTIYTNPTGTQQEQINSNIASNEPFNNAFPSSSSSTLDSKLPDLKSLLSKLTEAGLITQKDSNEKSVETKPEVQKRPPKQFLPLDMLQLKQYHQFVIDQLYDGMQCNCSLRFAEEHCQVDSSGKKSRYSRHLDWHFRQNRRDKTKPGSAAVAHRRSWYYNVDQWILFKEVNDDIDEDNSAFFDSNPADSPSTNNKTSMYNINFSDFKDSITQFNLFIETISCDNNKINNHNKNDNDDKNKICSVVAESDVASNCVVCNEQFDLKWFEDEEEWRLMNAVCYTSRNAEGQSIDKNFHPLCLKDYLLQQLEKEQQSQNSSQLDETNNSSPNNSFNNSNSISSISSRVGMIPGLDTPLKEEDDLIKTEPDDDEMNDLDHQKNASDQNEQQTNSAQENDEDEQSKSDIKMESFEVKVEEFEIPIAVESSIEMDSNINPENSDNNNPDGQNENQKPPQQQTKRAGIVIKMKGSAMQIAENQSTTVTCDDSNHSEHGNVLASDDDEHSKDKDSVGDCNDGADDEAMVTDQQNDREQNNKQSNDDDDVDDDDSNNKEMNIVDDDVHDNVKNIIVDNDDNNNDGSNDIATNSIVQVDNNNDNVDVNIVNVDSDKQIDQEQPNSESNDDIDADADNNVDESILADENVDNRFGERDEDNPPAAAEDEDHDDDDDGDHQSNYYSRGKEISSLCTIM